MRLLEEIFNFCVDFKVRYWSLSLHWLVNCQMVTLAKRGDAHAEAQARAFLRVSNIFVLSLILCRTVGAITIHWLIKRNMLSLCPNYSAKWPSAIRIAQADTPAFTN